MTDLENALRPLVAKLVADELAKRRPSADGDHLTVAAYAARYSISERTVRDAIRDRRLETIRIGRAVRVPAGAQISPRVDAATARARLVLLGGRR